MVTWTMARAGQQQARSAGPVLAGRDGRMSSSGWAAVLSFFRADEYGYRLLMPSAWLMAGRRGRDQAHVWRCQRSHTLGPALTAPLSRAKDDQSPRSACPSAMVAAAGRA